MKAPLAAAYVGVSHSKFLEDVKAGKYPEGDLDGTLRLWCIEDLDAAVDEMKGSASPSNPFREALDGYHREKRQES